MKVFLEVGYTNLKVIINNNEDLALIANASSNLEKFINNFDFTKDHLYVLNNNSNFNELLNSFKQHNNYFLFDHKTNKLDLKLSSNFNQDELGDDLRFLIYYLSKQKGKNIVLMSNGSCLATIVKQDRLVKSISINLGISTSIDIVENNYKLVTDRSFFNKYATNTNDALSLGVYLMFKGILMSTLENFHIKNRTIILCGHGHSKDWIKKFQNTAKFKIKYCPDLTLKTFRSWCFKNLK